METQTALSVVCRLGKSRLISGVYPEQFELRSSLFDGLKTRQNPESTNYRYGTLICDLERGLPIDVLTDRTVETVSAWLKEHPTIDTISRDGSSEYASAIKKGAPQAREVSDRWHLVKNLAGCVSVLLASCLAQLRRAETAAEAQSQQEEPLSHKQPGHPRTRAERQAQQARQAERQARYEQITALQNQGMKSAEIAVVVGMAERTVRHWQERGDIPYSGPRKPRSSPLDPYKTYLLECWHQGCRSGAQLERELRAKGYKGSQKAIYRCLASLELFVSSPSGRSCASSQPNPLLALSASQATWLFFRKEEDLKAEEQENLRQLRQASPDLECALPMLFASSPSKLCRNLSVNSSASRCDIAITVCRSCDFGTIALPQKLLTVLQKKMPVLPVIPVLAANLSGRNGKPMVATNSTSACQKCQRCCSRLLG